MASDRKIVAALCRDLPESLTPFEDAATRVEVSQEDFLASIEGFRRSGILRRFGATVDHRRVGFRANAMVVWRIPDAMVEEAAGTIVSSPAVSHCYQRKSCPSWPYNLYAMIHGETRKECEEVAAGISRAMGSGRYRLLFSVREFKKTSPAFFGSTDVG